MDFHIFFFVLILYEVSDSTYSPYGMKMCRILCQQTGDCTMFGFSQVHQLCIIRNPKADGNVRLYNVSRDMPALCGIKSRHIMRRDGRHVCIKEPVMKILIVPTLSKKKDIAILCHGNYKRGAIFTNVPSDGIYSIAYLSIIRKLVVSRKKSPPGQRDVIELQSLTSTSSEILVEDLTPRALAVDDNRQLVFFINEGHMNSVCGVNAVSKASVVVRKQRIYGTASITADTRRKQLYISLSTVIISLLYNGTNEQTIAQGLLDVVTTSLSYDADHLLFSDGSNVMQLSIETKRQKMVHRYNKKIFKIINYKGKSFITFFASKFMVVLDRATGISKYTRHIEDRGLQMCIIEMHPKVE